MWKYSHCLRMRGCCSRCDHYCTMAAYFPGEARWVGDMIGFMWFAWRRSLVLPGAKWKLGSRIDVARSDSTNKTAQVLTRGILWRLTRQSSVAPDKIYLTGHALHLWAIRTKLQLLAAGQNFLGRPVMERNETLGAKFESAPFRPHLFNTSPH